MIFVNILSFNIDRFLSKFELTSYCSPDSRRDGNGR